MCDRKNGDFEIFCYFCRLFFFFFRSGTTGPSNFLDTLPNSIFNLFLLFIIILLNYRDLLRLCQACAFLLEQFRKLFQNTHYFHVHPLKHPR